MKQTRNFAIILFFILLFSNLSAQETYVFNHDLADYEKAVKLYEDHLFAAAKKAFLDVKSQFDDFTELQYNCDYYIASCAIQMEEPNANNMMQDFVSSYPNALKKNDALQETAQFYYNKGNYSKAIQWFTQVQPENLAYDKREDFYFNYGYTLFKTNQLEASKEYFKQLLYSKKYGSKAKYYYGFIAYQKDDYQEAEQYLEDVSQDVEYNKEVSYYLADMSFKSGQFQKAIDQALPLLDTAKRNELSEINKIIGESHFNLNQYTTAIPYLMAYKGKRGKWNNTDYYQLGYCYYKQGDYEKAIDQFNKIIDGKDAVAQNAYYHLAECYLKLDKKTEALNAFMNASQMDFDAQIKEDAYLNYAKLSYDIGNPYKPAAEVLQDYLEAYPFSTEKDLIKRQIISAYDQAEDYSGGMQYLEDQGLDQYNATYQKMAFQSGLKAFNNTNYAEALDKFSASLSNAVDPVYVARTTFWQAETNYQLKNYEAAKTLFNKFKSMNQASGTKEYQDVNYQLGYVNFKQKNYQTAANYFENYTNQSVSNIEKFNDASLRLADMYFATSSYQKAYNAYQNILDVVPAQADYALFQSALSLGFLNQNGQKISLLEQLTKTHLSSSYMDDALYVLGNTYTTQNQTNEAISTYDQLINGYPQSSLAPRALLKKGLIYYNEGEDRKALDTYKKAVALYPDSPIAQEAVQNARRIYIAIGEVDEYAEWVGGLSNINVSNNEIEQDMYDSANQFYIKGDYRKAADAFAKYLKEFSNGAHALEAHFYLAESLANENNMSKAVEHYRFVADASTNQFTEQALVQFTNYWLKQSQWDMAVPYLVKLEKVASHSQNVLFAQSNLMKAYYQSGDYTKAELYADKCLNNALADSKVKSDAQLIIARSAVKNGNMSKARTTYEALQPMAQGEVKAEALYYDAYFKHLDGNYKNSNVVVQKIASDYAGYKYWGAKSLIIMAKNFYELNDAYQATYILENVIQNFPQFTDVVTEAQTELNRIKAEQAKTNNSVNTNN